MPTKYPYCRHLQAMADGTLFLVSAVDNRAGTDTAIFRLSPGDTAFEQITDDDPENYVSVTPTDMQFLVTDDAETIYGFGDGAFSFGLVRATL